MSLTKSKPIRVLHALGGLGHGGIETWLMQIAPRVDQRRIQMDFLVHSEGGVHESELRSRGFEILTVRPTGVRRPWSYLEYPWRLDRMFRERPAYDVVHNHMQEFGGYFLRAAFKASVPVRIAHSHNGGPLENDGLEGPLRRAYNARLRRWVQRYATTGFACSQIAAESLFGVGWQSDPRWRILHYGIDLNRFGRPSDGATLRRSLGLPTNAQVVGHVGRFVPQKNHDFLIRIAAECVRRKPDVYFLLVGDGPLRADVELQVQKLGLSERIRFAGPRSDVPQLMMSAMDLMVLPSLWEGLPVVALEAQAANRRILISSRVSDECSVVPSQVDQLSLDAGPEGWAERILGQLDQPDNLDKRPIESLQRRGMTIDASVDAVLRCYTSAEEAVAP